MPDKTAIEWTDATWNPIRGCSRVSEGCRHCYAEPIAARFSGSGQPYEGLGKFVTPAGSDRREARWTGKVAFAEHLLDQPLRWRAPRRIFVNSMSDLFHESVPDEWIDRIFAVMALCPQHTFQILTKRPARMRTYLAQTVDPQADSGHGYISHRAQFNAWLGMDGFGNEHRGRRVPVWPLPNVWVGVSVEDQVTADTRIPILLLTPAAKRFISAEPLLAPIDLVSVGAMPPPHRTFFTAAAKLCSDPACRRHGPHYPREFNCRWGKQPMGPPGLDWVIVGGESGPGARPMHPDWAISLRDQCAAAGTSFFFKQWGAYLPRFPQYAEEYGAEDEDMLCAGRDFPQEGVLYRDGYFYDGVTHQPHLRAGAYWVENVGKAAAGRMLDGRTHDGIPS